MKGNTFFGGMGVFFEAVLLIVLMARGPAAPCEKDTKEQFTETRSALGKQQEYCVGSKEKGDQTATIYCVQYNTDKIISKRTYLLGNEG